MIFGRTFKPDPIPDDAIIDDMWKLDCAKYNGLVTGQITKLFFNQIGKVLDTLDPDASVLEVGCGLGESTKRLASKLGNRRFEAIEYDQRLVNKLHEIKFPHSVKHGSIYEIPYESKSFDGVICLEVLEHLENVDLALKELCRVARKKVIVSVPNEPLWCTLNMMRGKYLKDFGNTPGHTNHWSAKSFRALLSNYGEVEAIYKPLPFLLAELKPRA